jgi:hypothetical protein
MVGWGEAVTYRAEWTTDRMPKRDQYGIVTRLGHSTMVAYQGPAARPSSQSRKKTALQHAQYITMYVYANEVLATYDVTIWSLPEARCALRAAV